MLKDVVSQLKKAFSSARAYIRKYFFKKKTQVAPVTSVQANAQSAELASIKATDAKTSRGAAAKKKKKARKASPVNLADVRSVLSIFDKTDGEHWKLRAGWRSVLPVNQWWGVRIIESRIVELCLGTNSLKVTLAHNIALELSAMSTPPLLFCVQGPVPTEIGNLVALSKLALNENALTGSIPQALCNLKVRVLVFAKIISSLTF
jgi:hypothetical protein